MSREVEERSPKMTNNTTKTLKALAVAALALLGTTSVAGPTRADPNDDQILVSRLHDDGFGGPVENLVDDVTGCAQASIERTARR